jgi:hypothetical protein
MFSPLSIYFLSVRSFFKRIIFRNVFFLLLPPISPSLPLHPPPQALVSNANIPTLALHFSLIFSSPPRIIILLRNTWSPSHFLCYSPLHDHSPYLSCYKSLGHSHFPLDLRNQASTNVDIYKKTWPLHINAILVCSLHTRLRTQCWGEYLVLTAAN